MNQAIKNFKSLEKENATIPVKVMVSAIVPAITAIVATIMVVL